MVAGLMLGSGWSLLVRAVIGPIMVTREPNAADLDGPAVRRNSPIHRQFIYRKEDRPVPLGRLHRSSERRFLPRGAIVAGAAVLGAAFATTSTPAVADVHPAIVSGAGPNGPQTIPASDFVPHVRNPYFPLRPGTTFRYGGTKDGKPTVDVFHVTGRTKQILEVPCVSIADRLYESGKLAERTTDWYAEDRQGRVWYFGEETAELSSAGNVTSTEGSWQAGVKGSKPGIFMTKAPHPGQSFGQEFLRGEAEDHFRVTRLGVPASVPAGRFPRALETREWTPLEPDVIDRKLYVRGIGEVSEETVKGPIEIARLLSVHNSG
ncbi:MAG: hypothetical protein JSR24_12570 [Proteobacteria bacterium]|nr:hypothetical protein [Pseudomonadota bacterium]